jgi:peptidoglycan endopeptidase LytE
LKARFDKVVYAEHTAEPVAVQTETAKEPAPAQQQPAPDTKGTSAAAHKLYTVKKGDTAFNIAKRYNMTVRELMDWNKLDDGVKIGQKLKVKE